MSNSQLSFATKSDFIQAAFEQVAKIVGDHGAELLECSVPATDTQNCLSHLATVALAWSYDPTLISALEETFQKSNEELQEYLGDF